MLTPRENMLRIFRHERPEWIPVTGHVDPYNQPSQDGMEPELAEKLRDVRWHDESTIVFSRALGIDILDYAPPPVRVTRRNVTVEWTTAENGDSVTTWHTPLGDLRSVNRQCREDGTSYLVEHLVKEPEDLPKLAAVFADEQVESNPDTVEYIRKRRALIGDDGMLMAFLPGTPLGMMYREYSGVETLAYLWADAREALHDLFAEMERNYAAIFQLTAQSEIDALVPMDDTSTTAISPEMFAACNLGYTDRMADIVHAEGKLYFHHSCGLIRDLLPLYRETRMDAVHGYSVPSTGNVTVAAGKPVLGDRITIIAGLCEMGELRWDPETIRSVVREMFTGAAPGDHFIFGIAAYPHRTMAQTRFAVECCREWQRSVLA